VGVEQLFSAPQYSMPRATKREVLVEELAALTRRHCERCSAYARIVQVLHPAQDFSSLETLPFLPASLFKTHRLTSVEPAKVIKTLTSSGTTGQAVSRIELDAETADLQSRALNAILRDLVGPRRLPMLIVDSKATISNRAEFSARGAGIAGMMPLGRDHLFVLDEGMALDRSALKAFLAKHSSQPILIFGFTFMVWKYLYQAVSDGEFDLSTAVLIHSGGWKALADQAVDNGEYKHRLRRRLGLGRIHNFYGMVEQTGSIFVEREDGLFYPSNFSEVLVRDVTTGEVLSQGEPGVLQVFSVLPRSYPGHSILTEDIGTIHDPATGAFSVAGRIPSAELRGCSDTHAAVVQASQVQ